jgi:phosphohistidine phosphatase
MTEPRDDQAEGTPAEAEPGPARGPVGLFLVRHADAGDPAMWEGDDDERPLSGKGRKQARRLGKHLDKLGAEIDLIVTSPKVRAEQTARLVGREIGIRPVEDERLASGFDLGTLAEIISGVGPSVRSVMLVGHDPDFSAALSTLVGAEVPMRKGALAEVDLAEGHVGAGRGLLRWLLPPDAIAG